ncbi:MAG: hypothetical protein PWQ17_2370 [Anaerophaga sp.]|nr:hypothetical protein [Anaerophaga thermohalophila]MDK2842864.1 hypothetical protein [Anaerophaga sp.]
MISYLPSFEEAFKFQLTQLDELEIPEGNQMYQIISKEFSCLNLI